MLTGVPILTGIAIDATALYVASGNNVLRAPRTQSGAAIGVASDTDSISLVAVDDAYVYWTTSCSISRAPKAGGNSLLVLSAKSSGCKGMNGLAVDATHVWWTSGSSVMRIAKPT